MRSFRNHLVELPRVARRSLAISTDAVLLALSLLVGAFLRFGEAGLSDRLYLILAVLAAISGVTVFWVGGLYREVLRYAGPRRRRLGSVATRASPMREAMRRIDQFRQIAHG